MVIFYMRNRSHQTSITTQVNFHNFSFISYYIHVSNTTCCKIANTLKPRHNFMDLLYARFFIFRGFETNDVALKRYCLKVANELYRPTCRIISYRRKRCCSADLVLRKIYAYNSEYLHILPSQSCSMKILHEKVIRLQKSEYYTTVNCLRTLNYTFRPFIRFRFYETS
jgi:hypothetical protein